MDLVSVPGRVSRRAQAWRECSFAFVAEDQHFVNCVLGLEEPLETGEDGKAVLEIIFAAYESAGTGCKVALPFMPPRAPQERMGKRPIELWLIR
ncbi:MAG: hypothetical protein ABFE07_19860 [Armatimonadia bacterium]